MKLTLLAAVLCIPVIGVAQQPKPQTPAQEAEAAQKQLVIAAAKFDAAQAELAVAFANRNAALYKLMAELGIKASECEAPGKDGKLNPFACVKIDSSGQVTVENPKAAKASPK